MFHLAELHLEETDASQVVINIWFLSSAGRANPQISGKEILVPADSNTGEKSDLSKQKKFAPFLEVSNFEERGSDQAVSHCSKGL